MPSSRQLYNGFLGKRPGFFALQAAEGGGGTAARGGFLPGSSVASGEPGVGGAMGAGGACACKWGEGGCC